MIYGGVRKKYIYCKWTPPHFVSKITFLEAFLRTFTFLNTFLGNFYFFEWFLSFLSTFFSKILLFWVCFEWIVFLVLFWDFWSLRTCLDFSSKTRNELNYSVIQFKIYLYNRPGCTGSVNYHINILPTYSFLPTNVFFLHSC